MDHLGPRARRAYAVLRQRLAGGDMPPGSRLPAQRVLAADLGVAPMTLREVLEQLQREGFVSSEHGRGTFVREPAPPAVLILDDEASVRALLSDMVAAAAFRSIAVGEPSAALEVLAGDTSVGLILADVRVPTTAAGTDFIRTARRTWPHVPLAAITAFPDDLTELFGTPECPLMILTKPFSPGIVAQALALALPKSSVRSPS